MDDTPQLSKILVDMGMDEVPLQVVLNGIKERRRNKAISKEVPTSGKAPVMVSPVKSLALNKKIKFVNLGTPSFERFEARGIDKKGPTTAIRFGDPKFVDLVSFASSSTTGNDDLNEALMLEEHYFGAGPDGPGEN
ncbi:hypothetical protein AMTRI_Chr01g135310 [Amborella trichopoda]